MEIFILNYELLDPEQTGFLAIYSNRSAAQEALNYAESLDHYSRVFIERVFVQEKFFKTDFD